MEEFKEKIYSDFSKWGQVLNVGEFSEEIKKKVILEEYNAENTRLIFSVCSDDCNRLGERENIEKSLTKIYGREFHLGSLAGYPIGGVSGIIAASHHVPDIVNSQTGQRTKGNLVFFISPHLGLIKRDDYFYGRLIRPGQQNASACCGAMMGFLNDLKQAGSVEDFNIIPDYNNLDQTRILIHEALINEYPNQLNKILTMDSVNSQIIELIRLNHELIAQKANNMINEFLKNESFQGNIVIITGITINCNLRDYFVLKEIKILNK